MKKIIKEQNEKLLVKLITSGIKISDTFGSDDEIHNKVKLDYALKSFVFSEPELLPVKYKSTKQTKKNIIV